MNDYAIVYKECDWYDVLYVQAESFESAREKLYDKKPDAFAVATYENPDNKRMKEILRGIRGK